MNSTEGHPDRESIFALMEGELPKEEAASVAEHLVACSDCRSYAQLLGIGDWFFTEYRRECFLWELPPPPLGWRRPPRRRAWWLLAGVAATLILALMPMVRRPLPNDADAQLVNKVDAQISQALPTSFEPMLQLVSYEDRKENRE